MNNPIRFQYLVRRAGCLAAFLSLGVLSEASAANLVVYGGTGNIGSRIVTEALNRGHTVTVISRNAEAKQQRARLSVQKGDILDTAGVAQQIAGREVVISTISSREEVFFTRAARSVITAMNGLGPQSPRLIWVGGASSLEIEPGKRWLDTMPAIAPGQGGSRVGHTQVLEYFRTLKDVKWTFISPSMDIVPGERTGKFRIGGDQMLKDAQGKSRISMEDFAVAILDEIEKPQQIGKRFTVGY